jgi:hypothetical protein
VGHRAKHDTVLQVRVLHLQFNSTNGPVCRLTAPYSPAPDSDNVQIEPRLRHRAPLVIAKVAAFLALDGSITFALGGSISLHLVAELIVFGK